MWYSNINFLARYADTDETSSDQIRQVKPMNEIFDKLVKSKIEQFENDYITLSRQIFVNSEGTLIHPGEFGVYRERIIKEFLSPFLPTRLAIGSGFIITAKNRISTQCDIIIYDKEHTPLIENSEQRFFPVECVVGVIEVKSKLTKSSLKDALIKLAAIKDLRNDIDSNPYIFKNYIGETKFDAKLKVRDQMATFLICESIDIDIEKEIDSLFSNIYSEVDKSLFHNMILSLDDCCYLYNDGTTPMFYAYYDYTIPVFKNSCILPDEAGYEKEHILLFLNYFYMLISSVSVMDIEITNYLGATRPHKELIQK